MRRVLHTGATLLALILPLQAAAQAEESGAWLVKMSEAARTANYQGIVTYRAGQGEEETAETFRVTHRFHNGIERERVQSLTGELREVEKKDSKMTCTVPKARRATAERPTPKGLFPGLTPERVRQISQVYQFDDLGQTRVAGRLCRGMAITPRDNYRYGYEVWADAQSAVPLKVMLRGRDGSTLETMEFTEVEFPASIPDSAFAPSDPALPAVPAVAAPANPPPAAVTEPAAPDFGPLPPGFQVTLRDVREVPGKGKVEHWLLSDGLSAISVFTTRRSAPARGFQGISRIGALNAYGRVSGSLHITVVGEVPPQTVRMVGDGVQPVADAEPAAKP